MNKKLIIKPRNINDRNKFLVAVESTKPAYSKFPYTNKRIHQTIAKALKSLGLGVNGKKFFKKVLFDNAKVVIKPNYVFHVNNGCNDFESLVTHSSIIKAIIDMIISSNRNIQITILDVPMQSANWDSIIKKSRIDDLVTYYKEEKGVNIQLIDARRERVLTDPYGTVLKRYLYNGDPEGYVSVQLGSESELNTISEQYQKFEVTDYNIREMRKHQNRKKHEYLISKTVLESDLFINVPKLKCHKRAGITICLKNMIGINGSKDWLPHHRRGSLFEGGDEYLNRKLKQKVFYSLVRFVRLKTPRLYKYIADAYYFINGKTDLTKLKFNEKSIQGGSWYNNDTIWRTILDVNKIILYADKNGVLKNTPQRKYIAIVDGIIGMEREGPLTGTPKKGGIILAGFEPSSVDLVATRLMGFDENKIPQLNNLKNLKRKLGASSIDELTILSSNKKWKLLKTNPQKVSLNFVPAAGWKDHVELRPIIKATELVAKQTLNVYKEVLHA